MPWEYHFYVYILTNYNNKVMYIGVTNSLERRIYEHCTSSLKGSRKNIMYINWCIMSVSRIFAMQSLEKNN